MSIPYSHDYFPAFPVLTISLAPVQERVLVGPLIALIDTGADGTTIPLKYLIDMDIPLDAPVRIRGPWGHSRSVKTFTVDIVINGVRFPNIEVVGDPLSEDILVGRNILNRFILLLDGPNRATDVYESRPPIRQKGIL
jgi:predicted aspartyl protease